MQKKVTLVYKDIEDNIAEETIWTHISEKGYYIIDNIPFFAPNLALNDVISVEEDEGILYFDGLILSSGYSTVQLVFFDLNEIERVLNNIESWGCGWEGMKNMPYYAISVPGEVDYKSIKLFLNEERNKQVLDFKEACLSEKHR